MAFLLDMVQTTGTAGSFAEIFEMVADNISWVIDARNECIDSVLGVAGYVNGIAPARFDNPTERVVEAKNLLIVWALHLSEKIPSQRNCVLSEPDDIICGVL